MSFNQILALSILVIGVTHSDFHRSAFAQSPAPLATPTIVKPEGAPMRIDFSDGRSAEFVIQKVKTKFTTSLRLLENTCKPLQVAHCKISFPYISSTVSTKWTSHPTNKGELVQMLREKDFAVEVQGSSKFTLYSGDKTIPTLENSPFGELSCDTNEWLPWKEGSKGQRKAMITLWDEDFETINEEFSYHRRLDPPSFNAFTARFDEVPLFEAGQRILMGGPESLTKRFFVEFPLLAYRLQLTFMSPNLTEPEDGACQVKMEVDFSKVFETVTSLFNVDNKNKYDPKAFVPIVTGSPEAAQIPEWWLSDTQRWYRELR